MSACVFCAIIAGAESAQIVREWRDAIAFVPLNPIAAGHSLVVPRQHVRDAVENQAVTALTMARAAELAKEYSASDILTSIGTAATQSVFHLHVHVVPRAEGDQLMVPWGAVRRTANQLDASDAGRQIQARVNPAGFVAQRFDHEFNGGGQWVLTYMSDIGIRVEVHNDDYVQGWQQLVLKPGDEL